MQATTAHPPSPVVRLVDQWQTHLKFNGREPRTLEELAIAKADYEHRRSRAEIKTLQTKLRLLDEHLPALAARGINLAYRDFATYDSGKTLRILPSLTSRGDDKLLAALLALGFREVGRKDWGVGQELVTLKHGRALVVAIDVSKPAASDAAAPAARAATGSGA